jgi:hypothetical protein
VEWWRTERGVMSMCRDIFEICIVSVCCGICGWTWRAEC